MARLAILTLLVKSSEAVTLAEQARSANLRGPAESSSGIHFVTHRSCSQDPEDGCNHWFKEDMKKASLLAEKAGIPKENTHAYLGFPQAIMDNPVWQKFVAPHTKGRGFWFWKPVLLNLLLNDEKAGIKDGDFVIYLDGDIVSWTLQPYLAYAQDQKHDLIVARQRYCEYEWTKGDVFQLFGVQPTDPHYARSQQYLANQVAFRVNAKTRRFFKLWEELNKDYELISDTPSKVNCSKYFKEGRHDQSFYSMLIKASFADNGWCWDPDKNKSDPNFILPTSTNKLQPWKPHDKYGIEGLSVVFTNKEH